MQRPSSILFVLFLASFVASCSHSQGDPEVFKQQKKEGLATSAEHSESQELDTTTLFSTPIECETPPADDAIVATQKECGPCSFLPPDIDLMIALNMENTDENPIIKQLKTGSTFFNTTIQSLPKRACIGVKYRRNLETTPEACAERALIAGTLIENPIFILSYLASPEVDESILVFDYDGPIHPMLNAYVNMLRFSIQPADVATEGLEQLQQGATRFQQIATLNSGKHAYLYQPEEEGRVYLGTSRYLLTTTDEERVAACEEHNMEKVLRSFRPATLQVLLTPNYVRYAAVKRAANLPLADGVEISHLGAAFTFTKKAMGLELKSFVHEGSAIAAEALAVLNYSQLKQELFSAESEVDLSSLFSSNCGEAAPPKQPNQQSLP